MMLYFAYGSNLNLGQMKVRCPKAEPVETATLTGYRLCFKTHADVIAAPRCKVIGGLYKITAECERALDRYEGFPRYYGKEFVTLDDGREVMFYAIINGAPLALPQMYYLQTILDGYRDWKMTTRHLSRAVSWTAGRVQEESWNESKQERNKSCGSR